MAKQHRFGERSLKRLGEVDERLQEVVHALLPRVPFDLTVLCGHRTEDAQEAAVLAGRSKVRFPHSKHNALPSKAVDIAPYPVDWEDLKRFEQMGREAVKVGDELGTPIRWGADWDRDGSITDERFLDFPHLELWEPNAKRR